MQTSEGLSLDCLPRGDSLHRSLVALIEDSPVLTERTDNRTFTFGYKRLSRGEFMGSDLCYSDGVDPEQQGVFIFTAQELDVV